MSPRRSTRKSLFSVRIDEQDGIIDFVHTLAGVVLPSDWSLAVISSSQPPDLFLESALAASVPNQVKIVDWYSHATERVIGVEDASFGYKCARDPLNVKVAVNKILREWKGRDNILVVADYLPSALRAFGEENSVLDAIKGMTAKARKEGATLVFVVDASFESAGAPVREALPEPIKPEQLVADLLAEPDGATAIADEAPLPVLACGECGSFFSSIKEKCPLCGWSKKDSPVGEPRAAEILDVETPGICDKCGALVPSAAEMCPNCGSSMLDTRRAQSKLLDVLQTTAIDIGLCQECGAFVNKGKPVCSICGAKIDPATMFTILQKVLKDDKLETVPADGVDVCVDCGAFMSRHKGSCPVCGSSQRPRDNAEEVEIELAGLESLAKLVDDQSCQRCGAMMDEVGSCPVCGLAVDLGELDLLMDIAEEALDEVEEREQSEELMHDLEAFKDALVVDKERLQTRKASVVQLDEVGLDSDVIPEEIGALADDLLATDGEPMPEEPIDLIGGAEEYIMLALDDIEKDFLLRDGVDAPEDAKSVSRDLKRLEPVGGVSHPGMKPRGLTNGIAKARGMTNGLGKGGGKGRINGLVNGAGRGQTNGLVNGSGRGRTNGLTNGLTNGRGRTNGLTNGRGRTNGFTNGMTNGLTNGSGLDADLRGLANGLGLTNGLADYSSSGRAERHSAQRLKTTSLLLIAVLLLMLTIPLLSTTFVPVSGDGGIDGDFSEWKGSTVQLDKSGDCPAELADIVEGGFVLSVSGASFYAKLSGDVFAGDSGNEGRSYSSGLFVFIDADDDALTGYAIKGIGADYLVESSGCAGKADVRICKRFDPAAERDDWNGFRYHSAVSLASDGQAVEFFAQMDGLSTDSTCVIAATDGYGALDYLDTPLIPGEGAAYAICQAGQSQDGGEETVLLDCYIYPSGPSDDIGLEFEGTGFGPSPSGATPRLYIKEVPIELDQANDTSLIFSARGLTFDDGSSILARLACVLPAGGPDLSVWLSHVAVGEERLTITESGRFFRSAPHQGIEIDGDFSDWVGVPSKVLAEGDVHLGDGSIFVCSDIDMIGIAHAESSGSLYIKLDVAGEALGGSAFPTFLPRRQPASVAPASSDHDLDGVPDNADPMPDDFDNDGVNDTAEGGDRDGDGIIDWPGGPDVWLNTTTPMDFPPPYENTGVSIFIGPVSLPPMRGEDVFTIYTDADGDSSTGLPVRFGFGAEKAVVLRGSGGLVKSANVFQCGFSTSWSLSGPTDAAACGNSLEVLVGTQMLPEGRILVISEDWQGAFDETQTASPAATRTPAGDNVVLNEISVAPNTEWIEVCNPTAASIDVSSWRIRVGNTYQYTFPAGTVLGAWGTGTEYLAVDVPKNAFPDSGRPVRLVNTAGTTVDETTYPRAVAGTSWSRFKDEDTGMPEDTDDDASDWYVSNNNWIVPDGATRGAPNGRKMPVIRIDKTVDLPVVEVGEVLTYTIWFNNTGDGNAKSVWVNDTMPAGTSYVSAAPVPQSVTGQNVVWYFGTVAHDTVNFISLTVRVSASIADGTALSNVGTADYHDALGKKFARTTDWANATAWRPTVTVSKVADVAQALAGSIVTYTIFYNNTGSRTAANVWINDTLPQGVTFVSSSVAPASSTGLTHRWYFANVAPGAHSFTITVQVNATAPCGTIVNLARLNYTSSTGRPLSGSEDTASVVIPEYGAAVVPVVFMLLAATATRRREPRKSE